MQYWFHLMDFRINNSNNAIDSILISIVCCCTGKNHFKISSEQYRKLNECWRETPSSRIVAKAKSTGHHQSWHLDAMIWMEFGCMVASHLSLFVMIVFACFNVFFIYFSLLFSQLNIFSIPCTRTVCYLLRWRCLFICCISSAQS